MNSLKRQLSQCGRSRGACQVRRNRASTGRKGCGLHAAWVEVTPGAKEKSGLSLTAAAGAPPYGYVSVSLALLVGCAVSVYVFTVERDAGRAAMDTRFPQQAEQRVSPARSVETCPQEVEAVAASFDAVPVKGTGPGPIAVRGTRFQEPVSSSETLDVVHGRYAALCASAAEFLTTGGSWTSRVLLGSGLLLVGILGAYISLTRARAEHTRRLACEALQSKQQLEGALAECRQAEAAFRESARNYRTLLGNLPQRIFLKDRGSRYLSCNEKYARDLNIDPAAIVGKTDYELYPKQFAEKYRADDRRIMDSGVTEDIEERYIQDGKEAWVHTVKTPVRDDNGNVVGVLGIFWDVTESKRAEEQRRRSAESLEMLNRELERSNHDLEEFTHTVSHDLQEPLRKIHIFGQFLAEDLGEGMPVLAREHLQGMREAAVRMQGLIQHLLGLARVGTQGRTPVEVAPGTIIDKVLDTLSERVREAGVEVSVAADLPEVMADPVQLEQVFQNLLGNALKFRAPDRPLKVTVSATVEGEEVRFAVSDNGIGIEKRFFNRIFGIFQRLHPRERYEGAGVGLALSAKIVRRHGGRIWVESEVGKGSTFYFTFPALRGSQGGNR